MAGWVQSLFFGKSILSNHCLCRHSIWSSYPFKVCHWQLYWAETETEYWCWYKWCQQSHVCHYHVVQYMMMSIFQENQLKVTKSFMPYIALMYLIRRRRRKFRIFLAVFLGLENAICLRAVIGKKPITKPTLPQNIFHHVQLLWKSYRRLSSMQKKPLTIGTI